MLISVLSGIILSIFILFFSNKLNAKSTLGYALIPIGLFVYFLQQIPSVRVENAILYSYKWIPEMNVNLDFNLDGLSLLFCLLISGIGSLIFVYASKYLIEDKDIHRFFGYLSLFMSAMLGMVLSDNVISLFLFWEITSISSFFLIGHYHYSAASRKSALVSLGVTGAGGLVLFAGLIWMAQIAGSYSIQEIIKNANLITSHPYFGGILTLLFIGTFTKSAQFPFHFWLPGAMKAPTPVSAYLHSATMVKAGIYLLIRFSPAFQGYDIWNITLTAVGGITLFLGAAVSVSKVDLKSILAYTTISALGIMVFLIGIGSNLAIKSLGVFIVIHALYKATLFLITGIIDHTYHTRNITLLSGLRKDNRLLFVSGLIAAFSAAGIPLTFGFIGKELVYDAVYQLQQTWAFALLGVLVLANILMLYSSFTAGITPFIGKKSEIADETNVKFEPKLAFAPVLLALFCILFGIFPQLFEASFLDNFSQTILTDKQIILSRLHIWHGFNIIFILSAITIFLGTVFYLSRLKRAPLEEQDPRFSMGKVFYRLNTTLKDSAFKITHLLHNGYLRKYLLTIIVFSLLVLGYAIFKHIHITLDFSRYSSLRIYEVAVAIMVIISVITTISTSSRLTAIVSMSVVGYCICLFFVFYSAPDLALTQFTIDTLTVVLFVLVLFRLPSFINFANRATKFRDAIVSILFGLFIGIIALGIIHEPHPNIVSKFYANEAYISAHGKNVVNVILVDFRGFDTLFEIVVLSIAGIGVVSLLKLQVQETEKE